MERRVARLFGSCVFGSRLLQSASIVIKPLMCVLVLQAVLTPSADAQVRTKRPDRGTYQPPTLGPAETSDVAPLRLKPLQPVRIGTAMPLRDPGSGADGQFDDEVQPVQPAAYQSMPSTISLDEPILWEGGIVHDPHGHTGEMFDGSPMGCDSMGGCGSCDGFDDGCRRCGVPNASISRDPCRWFGSMEVLLMFDEGDFVPALITTGTVTNPRATVLAGDTQLFDEMTAGGRVTIGAWLDNCHNRSLVGRIWSATEEDYDAAFSAGDPPIVGVPFTNAAGAPQTNLIVFPDGTGSGRFGNASVAASRNVFGGDVSVRQYWTGGLGTTFDVLYGYQYMRIDEQLMLSTTSTLSEQVGFTPPGSTIAFQDDFDTFSEFHGGQFGVAGRYREGCWSFDFLAKLGFGQVNRQADLRGTSQRNNGGGAGPVPSDEGFLIRNSNAGTFEDATFGWVPELNVNLGWQKYPRFDVTVGYHLMAMTDALQFSSVIDTVIDDTNGTRPTFTPVFDTYYVHGINFGIRHVF